MAERRSARRSSRGGGDSVTVQDLADAAGVSVASVSRALNNTGNVSEDVLRRVRDVADKMGYVPHAAARALASQSTHTIGAVVPTLENPNFAIGVEALQKRLTQAGYTLFVASCPSAMR
jgi:LacI family transcriptional regulator